MTEADLIWNRACSKQCTNPCSGDTALAALLTAHGLTMNGGVLHTVECLTSQELVDAKSGYRFFGLGQVADLMSRARQLFEADEDLEYYESLLDTEYESLIPDDSLLLERFEKHLQLNPTDFAPLGT